MFHGAFVSVDQQIPGIQGLRHPLKFFDHRIRSADYDYSGLLLVLVRQCVPHVTCEHACGAVTFDLQGLPRLITRRVYMFSRAALSVPFGPHKVAADFLSLLLSVCHQYFQQVSEVFWTCLVSGFFGCIDVNLFQPFGGLHDGTEVHVWVPVLSCPHHAFWASRSWKPDIRHRFLHRQDPRVHYSVLVVFPFVSEGARLCPAFDDQIMRLFEPFSVLSRVNTCLKGFDGPAAHEP